MNRRTCRTVMVGGVPMGGDAPITVQSMDESVSNHASISTLSTYDQSSRIITILARKVSQLILLREYICFVSLF